MSNLQPFRHILIIEDQKGRRIVSLENSTYAVGRDSRNSIVIYDYQVSRVHATLLRRTDYQNNQDFYRVIDGDLQGKRSTNGLFINGKTCLTHDLKHGDLVKFGGRAKATYQIISNTADIDLFKTDDKINLSKNYLNENHKQTLTSDNTAKSKHPEKQVLNQSQEELEKLASFPELSPNPIIELDWEGNITYINPAASIKFRNIDKKKLEHPILAGLVKKQQNRKGNLFVREVKIGLEIFEQYVHYLSEKKAIRSYIFDFTKRKQIEDTLRESERRYKAIVKQTSDGICLLDATTHTILEANPAYCKLLGYSSEEILKLQLENIIVDDNEEMETILENILREKKDFIGQVKHQTKNGNTIFVEISISFITYGGKEIFCFVVRDFNKNKQLENKTKDGDSEVLYDFLTGLPNRKLFNGQLSTALANAKRYQNLMSIIFLELPEFDKIRTSIDPTCSDYLLKELASRVRGCLRAGDTLARWSPSRFIILLPQIKIAKDPAKIGKRIIEILKQPFEIPKLPKEIQEIQGSIGISIYPIDGEDEDSLLKNVNTALEKSKEKGTNNFGLYSVTMSTQTSKLLRLETMLNNALIQKEFLLYYQPQINLKTGKITGFEALLRWQHPELGQISPNQFIHLAEDTNLIIPMGRWVLETACSQNKAWQKAGLPKLPISVNLSPRQFQESNLLLTIDEVLQATELEPQWLELEITEKSILQNKEFARKNLEQLKLMKVRVGLDDFGVGNISFGYLQNLPFNTIKIDNSLIESLNQEPQKQAIIKASILVAQTSNLRVIAEGVEKVEQLQLLKDFDCEEIQGFLFSNPVTMEEATKLLKRGSFTIPW